MAVDLRYQWKQWGILERLIVINVGVYLVSALLPFLFQVDSHSLWQWFHMPKDIFDFLTRPWTLITYAFFHGGIWHLFWNMIMLYFAGRIFLNLFGAKRFINVYFLGVVFGGIFFLLSYNLFPVFNNTQAVLLGASAGVMAILIFVCTYMPNQEVRLFVFTIKLWYLGVALVLLDLAQIPINNSGGHIAHLGGALLGYLYASQLTKGNDIGGGFEKIWTGLVNMFKPKPKSHLKTVYRKKEAKPAKDLSKAARQRKVDAILDKIGKSGYSSLTHEEKEFLINSGKDI
ncbi:rhomboid family protein [Sediminicola luteus]|uniref:Rhomboid family intramembrane serine protease n=1 Tax=Sediminicola luteus TaxID=319238 RepID=A0A2A4GAP8_9FLAO|nr:rhomboid family intramembrane serine protease [Sediminicola luteus]PCE64835.1 rhomboid family intramembrane serine protease [Sediminicola luteus]